MSGGIGGRATDGQTAAPRQRGYKTAGGLSQREGQVAVLVARGLTNREVAANLVIAPTTVARHVEHILAKLGLRSRAQIAAWAATQPQLMAAESE